MTTRNAWLAQGLDESDYDDLLAEERWKKRRHAELMRHPDCRDPDHPGCERCEEDDDDS
jgi:hypothetical protein